MLDFNDIINEILKTPSPLSLYLLPFLLPLLPPPAPSAASILSTPASLAPPLNYHSYLLRPPPVTSFKDIWDIPSLKEEEQEQEQEDKENKDNNAPASRPRYIIEFNI